MNALQAKLRVYSIHAPRGAQDFSRIDAIPDQIRLRDRVFAGLLPIVWMAMRRHWAILGIALVVLLPLLWLQVDQNAGFLVGPDGAPLGPDDPVEVSSAEEGQFQYAAATQLVVCMIMIVCAVFPAQVGRLDRDLRRWRHLGYLTATSRRDACEKWRIDPENLSVFDPADDDKEGARA